MKNLLPLLPLFGVLLQGCAADRNAPPDAIVVSGRYFDGEGQVVERGDIVVHEGRILCAGPAGECATRGASRRIEVSEGVVLPGLIDLHVHARPHYISAFPAAGVTSIRDANNTFEMVAQLRATSQAPRIFASGPMLDGEESVIKRMSETAGRPGEHPWDQVMPILVRDADDARAAIAGLAEHGANVVKLYEQLPMEGYAAAAEEAKKRGLTTLTDLGLAATRGLTKAQIDAIEAARLGVTSIEHLSGFALAYQRRGGDPRAEHLDDLLLDKLADEFAATGSAVVPTLAIPVHFTAEQAPELGSIPLADIGQLHMGGWWAHLHGSARNPAMLDNSRVDRRFAEALVPRLAARGVLIGAGTDTPAAPFTVPGGGMHQEMAYLVEFGLTPAHALRAATGDAARILGRDDLGRIRTGALADLIAVKGDPLADITATRNIEWVMQDGRISSPDELRKAPQEAAEAMLREAEAQEAKAGGKG